MNNLLNEFRSTNITWDKATSRIYSPVTANASDENGRKLVVQIVNGGQVEDLTGATLHLYWITIDKRHDGLDVFDVVDLKKGEFELSYTTGMLSNRGVLNANLVLIDTVGRVVSERFKITVTEGIDDDAIQSENSFSSLTQALIDIGNLEQNYTPRLNDLTAQLQQTEQELSSQLAQKATKDELDALGRLSIDGVYDTLSALETAIPSGESGLFLVLDDGFIYKWGGSSWAKTVRFQSSYVSEGLNLTNGIKNGNFDDTSNWDAVSSGNGTLTAINNELIYTVQGLVSSSRIQQTSISPVVGHKYYVRGDINPKYYRSSRIALGGSTISIEPSVNVWNKLSGIIVPINTSGFLFYHATDQSYIVGDNLKFRRMMAVDLTAIYGAGNEPTLFEFENTLSEFENDWFDGTAQLVPPMSIDELVLNLDKKVNRDEIDELLQQQNTTIINMQADGLGDYPNLRGALEASYAASDENAYEIRLEEGTYNIFDGYTNAEITNTSFTGPFLMPNVRLIGVGMKENTIIYGDLSNFDESTCGRVAPLNVTGGYELKNVTLEGNDTRYTVHDDYNYPNTLSKVENVHVIRKNGTKGSLPAWGEGTHSGMVRRFKNVTFETKAAHNPYATHNNTNFIKPSENYFDNCRFIANGSYSIFQIKSLGSGTKDVVEIKNCEFSGGVVNCIENATGDGFDYDLRIIGSDEVPVQITANDGSQPTYYQSGVTKITQNSGGALSKGDVVELRNDGAGVVKYTENDPIRFYGIALEDIASGEIGWIQYGGKFLKQEFPETASAVKFNLLGVSDGRLSVVTGKSNAVAYVHTGYFVKFI